MLCDILENEERRSNIRNGEEISVTQLPHDCGRLAEAGHESGGVEGSFLTIWID